MSRSAVGGPHAWGRTLFAVLFVVAGLNHFREPDLYLKIMPPSLPEPRLLVLVSGAAEVVLGAMLLVRPVRAWAAWGLIALLVAVFPANWFMWRHPERFAAIPPILLLLRLPLQGLLIAWAWLYTRTEPAVARGSVGPARAPVLLAVLGLALMPVAGCGGPSLARLDKGTYARAQSVTDEPILVYTNTGEEVLQPGTVVRVVEDAEETVAATDRKVLVGFLDGPHQGLAQFVRRRDLQPNPR